jgi:hypothetical protein
MLSSSHPKTCEPRVTGVSHGPATAPRKLRNTRAMVVLIDLLALA